MIQNSTGNTGTRDETYDLVSILYHALQGAETYDQYISDAEQRGDEDLAKFFRDTKEEERRRADRAKQLLAQRLSRS
jgi:rubrerythrin